MNAADQITHMQARELLSRSMDCKLEAEKAERLEQHLTACTECRQYAAHLSQLDGKLASSLQSRWPQESISAAELSHTTGKITHGLKQVQSKRRQAETFRGLGWSALVILLIIGVAWTIKTLAPLPKQSPAAVNTPRSASPSLESSQQPSPVPQGITPTSESVESGSPEATPPGPIDSVLPVVTGNFPGLQFSLPSQLPASPESLSVYRQQLSQAVTAESARQVAMQWGVSGGVYSSPSEGGGDPIYDVMDGARSIRFLNFPDQFIYSVGYTSPDYSSALMDSGPLPPFDEQVAIAKSFLDPLGILDMPYRTEPMETERGVVAFIPLLDSYPVIQEIGVDRSNIGWIDVKVSSSGQVSMVQYSQHHFQPEGQYPILTAQQAWERFTGDTSFQHSRYAVLSPERENTYQSWVHKYQPGQAVDIYGWVNSYQSLDTSLPPMLMINNLVLTGNTTGLAPDTRYDVSFVHAWGQIEDSGNGGAALNLAGWEASSLTEENITGTLSSQSGQTLLVAPGRTLQLVDPPADISDGIQVGVFGVVLNGNPQQISWRYIETGQIPFSYGSSSSCGGTGSGGGGSNDANFGGGSFSLLNLGGQDQPTPTQQVVPYQPGDAFENVPGTIYLTRNLYAGGASTLEVNFVPDPSSNVDLMWAYSLLGDTLAGIEQYNDLPIRVWGKVDRMENQTVYINIERYEPVYPGEKIQAWTGTEQLLSFDGTPVVVFTTTDGQTYVLKSSMDYPPADANIIGRLGDVIEIAGYLMPDQQVGGYIVMKDIGGSAQPGRTNDYAQVNVWDHSQDTSSNQGIALQGHVTIDSVELAYDATNLDRCQASAANDPNMAPYLLVQPMWTFTGHFDDGRRFFLQVQALPDEYFQ